MDLSLGARGEWNTLCHLRGLSFVSITLSLRSVAPFELPSEMLFFGIHILGS